MKGEWRRPLPGDLEEPDPETCPHDQGATSRRGEVFLCNLCGAPVEGPPKEID